MFEFISSEFILIADGYDPSASTSKRILSLYEDILIFFSTSEYYKDFQTFLGRKKDVN